MIKVVPIFLFFILSLASIGAQSTERITFIKFKDYLIPVTLPPEIDAPTLTATKDDANSVFLVWSQPAGATTYELWRIDPVLNWTRIYSGNDVTFTDVQPPAGDITYIIKPCNAEGCSRSRAQASVTIPEINTGGGWTFEDDPTDPENLDIDNDGVQNWADFCPDTPSGETANVYGCSPSQTGEDTSTNGLAFQCIESETVTTNNPNCPAELRDSDFDGIKDVEDPYPLQAAGFCPAN